MPGNADLQDDEFDLAALLNALWRGKWLVGLVALLCAVLAAAYVSLVPTPLFRAGLVMALDARDVEYIDFDSIASGLPADRSAIYTELGVIRSRILIGHLVDDMNLVADPEFNEALRPKRPPPMLKIRQLLPLHHLGLAPSQEPEPSPTTQRNRVIDEVSRSIFVTNILYSRLIVLIVQSNSPSKSALMANRLAALYIDEQAEAKNRKTAAFADWLSGTYLDLRQQDQQAERRLHDYQFTFTSSEISEAEFLLLLQKLKSLRHSFEQAKRRGAMAQVHLDDLLALDGASPKDKLVQTICAILDRLQPKEGSYADLITFVTDRPGHDARYAIDPTRIREELGWRPSVTVEEGLERTVRWYLDNRDWWQALLDREGVGRRLGTG